MKKHILPFAVLAALTLAILLPGTVSAAGNHDCNKLLEDAYDALSTALEDEWMSSQIFIPVNEFTGSKYGPYIGTTAWEIDSNFDDTNVIKYMRRYLDTKYADVELTIANVIGYCDEESSYAVIDENGDIHYDAVSEDNENYDYDIDINYYVTCDGEQYEVSFVLSCGHITYADTIDCVFVVPKHLTSRMERLHMAADYALASAAIPATVTKDISLPNLRADDSTAEDYYGFRWSDFIINTTWTSDHPEVISNSGKVTLPLETTTVTLTLTASYDEDYYEIADYLLDPGPFGDDEVRTVTVTVPGVGHTVTVADSYATESGAGMYKSGDTVSLHAGERAHYVFTGWHSSDAGVAFADATDPDTTFVMPNGDVSVTATWRAMTIFEDPQEFPYFYGRPEYTTAPKENKKDNENPSTDVNPPAQETTLPFVDVADSDPFVADVRFCYDRGLLEGMAADTFSPNDGMTRAMLVTVLWRMENEPVVNYAITFTDVPEGEWYSEAIRWAFSEKIIQGYDNGAFGTDDPITREQFFTILYRYANDRGYDLTAGGMAIREYDDCETISAYASDAMVWAVNMGLVPSRDGLLAPQETILRYEIAISLHAFCTAYDL